MSPLSIHNTQVIDGAEKSHDTLPAKGSLDLWRLILLKESLYPLIKLAG